MERQVLDLVGGVRAQRAHRPPADLAALDNWVSFLRSSAIEKSTLKHYTTGARDYLSFCTAHHIPFDPTPETLSRYIAYTSQFIASGPQYLSGARHFLRHFYPDFDANRSHPLVQTVIAGSRKIRADPVKRKLPLRPPHLVLVIREAVASRSYDLLLFATILTCAFYSCHRIGELVWPNDRSLRDWRKVIKRGSFLIEGGRALYHLPYHKGDRFFRGTHIVLSGQACGDPITVLKTYIQLRDSLHGAHPALLLRQDGTIPTRYWFDKLFFKHLDHSFGGHSVRAGGATFYASVGMSEKVIMALGRWSSEAWKDYVRENPAIRAELELARLRLP
jgi:hypothetical protein